MIEVVNLTKIYNLNVKALNQLSFSIKENEIIGFIGPNGAGKTTALKSLLGILTPTSGSIKILDYDVSKDISKIRNFVGYLPEETPLINEFTVYDYLNYRFILKTEGKHYKRNVRDVIELCELDDVKNRFIETLSKGFKQRVGIAESLLGDPKILFLDEPINGLDPDQIIKIRNLLQNLKNDITIVISSHILSELELISDKFLIISNGTLKAFGSYHDILQSSNIKNIIILEVDILKDKVIDRLNMIEEIESINRFDNANKIELTLVKKNSDPRLFINNVLNELDVKILKLDFVKPNLEALYMECINA